MQKGGVDREGMLVGSCEVGGVGYERACVAAGPGTVEGTTRGGIGGKVWYGPAGQVYCKFV